jgi:hypothetical protein
MVIFESKIEVPGLFEFVAETRWKRFADLYINIIFLFSTG